jgi:hypothetical protein
VQQWEHYVRAAEISGELGLISKISSLQGDSLIVVKAKGDSETNWRPLGQIVEDTKEVLGALRSGRICHVRREVNQTAHGL